LTLPKEPLLSVLLEESVVNIKSPEMELLRDLAPPVLDIDDLFPARKLTRQATHEVFKDNFR
jgi:hypothetical protein